jgi:hypothetical protein
VAEATLAIVGHSSNVGRFIEVIRQPEDDLPAAISVDIPWNPN